MALDFTVFLLDDDPAILAMPGLNGLAVQQALTLRGINRPIIFLTGQGTIPDSVLAMRAGAIDFLTKPVDKSDLMSAIKSAEERDKTQRPIEARRKIVIQSVAKPSRRERQVLALMVTGQINKRIAHTLGIREKTIKVHRSRVHQKMGVRSLAELLRTTIGIPLYDTSDIVGPWSNFHPVRMW